MCNLFRRVTATSNDEVSRTTSMGERGLGLMDHGDYHSAPSGYSPNTAYPESQYGSRFDEDADWNEENQ